MDKPSCVGKVLANVGHVTRRILGAEFSFKFFLKFSAKHIW